MPPIVTMTTDFGLSDAYVGQVKGVILSGCPEVSLIDLTHDIPPHNIAMAAQTLASSVEYFPARTIHLAVVDPGVGTDRRALVAVAGDHLFICPDNGLLTPILDRFPKAKVRRAINRDIFRKQVSPTFHGRDVFAPIAGFLAAGGAVGDVGPLIDDPIRLDLAEPRIKHSQIRGHIIHIDRFGNLISNISADKVLNSPRTGAPRFELAGQSLNGLHLTYAEAEPGEPLMLVGGFDLVEAAVNRGRADQFFDSQVGDEIIVYL